MSVYRTPVQADAHRQTINRWWPKRGNAWDALQTLERQMLEVIHTAPTAEIDRWMRSAYGCLEGAREMMALATAACEREARESAAPALVPTPTTAAPVTVPKGGDRE